MNGIRIVSTGSAIPLKKVTNEEISKIVNTSDAWIRTRTGIESRYFSTKEKNYELAAEAGRKAIEKGKIKKDEIAVILVATVSPDYMMPSTACMVQKELGIDEETMAFNINAACSGFLYGLKICKGILEQSKKRYALLIGSEQMSRLLDFEDRSTCVLFGDGAGAAIIELSEEKEYIQKEWSRGDDQALICMGPGYEKQKLFMDGSAVFRFAVTAIQQSIDALLKDANINIEDVDHIICHQANARIISHVRKKYHLPKEKFFVNLNKYANTSAASIPIVLDEMYESGLLKDGEQVILVGFGAGFTWAAAKIII